MVGDGDAGPAFAGAGRIVEADPPEFFVRRMAAHAHVLTEINQHVRDTAFAGQVHDAVHSIFLADAAEVERHARLRQENAAGPALDFVPADQLAGGLDVGIAGNDRWPLLPVPELHQRQRCRVERTAREEKQFLAEVEQPVGFGIGFHPMFAGGGVDSADEAVGDEPRVARLELADPRNGVALEIARHGGGDALQLDLAGRAHGAELQPVQTALNRRLRGLRNAGDGFGGGTGAVHHHRIENPTV